jgi:hypothetical protein
MVFVATLAGVSPSGVWSMLSDVPPPPKISLAKRIAPLADPPLVVADIALYRINAARPTNVLAHT